MKHFQDSYSKKILPSATIIIILLSLLFTLGCTEKEQPLTEITIPEHGNHIYKFSNDIRESSKIKCNSPIDIWKKFNNSESITFIFNGSIPIENSYFAVISSNIVSKLQTYYAYEGKIISDFPVYYYKTEGNVTEWYDARTDKPAGLFNSGPIITNATIWLLGPETGASETSVMLQKNVIFVQGTSYKNLSMAADKLVLVAMGITI